MKLKELLNRKITLTVIQRQCIIIVTLLSTLLLVNIWPRFRADVMEFPLYGYVVLIFIFGVVGLRKW